MGTYCKLIINDYLVTEDRNDVNPYTVALYDVDDLKTSKRQVDVDDDEYEELVAIFENTAGVILDRLQILGFTSNRSKDDFEESKKEDILRLKEFLAKDSLNEVHDRMKVELQILEEASHDDFLETVIFIIQNNIQSDNIDNYSNYQNFGIITYFFEVRNLISRFPHSDERNIIRAIAEKLPDGTLIKYDVTEYLAGELDEDEVSSTEIYSSLILSEELPFEDRINEKIIVLTEGSSDVSILQRSLNLLYPHLSKYYSFMDFNNAFVPGGSGALANYTRSFIGSNISVRVISLFDNDTAGYSAARPLSRLKIPNNFRILHLPDIEIASNYPTLGPTGAIVTNINRLACSIELYFGKDILVTNEVFCPIQWTGFDKTLTKYQGEILDKFALQEKFYQKISVCEADRNLIENYDWSDMKHVLQSIFNAFNN